MTFDVLVKRAEKALETAESRAKTARDELALLTDGKDDLNDADAKRASELMPELRAARAAVSEASEALDSARAERDAEAEIERRSAERHPTGAAELRKTADVHVTHEPRTYARENDPKGSQFIRDVSVNFMYRDPGAAERLYRHMNEEHVERGERLERAAGTAGNANSTNFGSIVVPQYLIDMTAPAVANMRPFADICNHHDLPAEGLSLTIPKITQGTNVSDQSAELAVNASDQSLTESDLTLSVRTALGDQTVSRQAIERGRGTDEIVMQDLVKRYMTNLDSQLINLASVGLDASAAAAKTYTAAPTLADFYSAMEGGAAGIESVLLGQALPSHVVMHSRRWHWLASQMSNTWPVVTGRNPVQSTAEQNNGVGYGSAVRGVLPNGLQVVVDNNISTAFTDGAVTNADHAYVVPSAECHLWEDSGQPVFIRAEQPAAAKLGVLLVLYGYYAFTYSRYPSGAVQVIKGLPVVTF
jgi:hypothetical protein